MKKILSTAAIAKMLGVDPNSVINWIDQKLLKAYRTPGGHRRVRVEDLIEFLRAHQMPIPPELRPRPTRILVVDDDSAFARMVAGEIAAANPAYETLTAHDGFEAGALVISHTPDVVILDLRMPGMDGLEVCRRIKSREETKHTEVLVVTAYPSRENGQSALRCGARACFTKPVDLEALLKEVEACLA